MLIYADLENAVIARLKAASVSGELGYRLLDVGSYGGQFDDIDAFNNAVRRMPAAWVAIGGDKVVENAGSDMLCEGVLAVMVATRNVRGEANTRHGNAAEPGTYRMVDDVRRILSWRTLGVSLDTGLIPKAVRTLFNTRIAGQAASVFAVEFNFRFTVSAALTEADSNMGEFLALASQYDINPHDTSAEHDKWLKEPPDYGTSAPELEDTLIIREK